MNSDETRENWLIIGRITGPHGLKGHVKVYPESDFPERFVTPGDRWLRRSGDQPSREPTLVQLVSGRYVEGKNYYLVKLAGVDYRDQAEALRQSQLLVPAGDRLPLEPGEFHVADLVGLTVVLQANQRSLGTITNVYTTGHDLLEVTLPAETTAEDSISTSHTDVGPTEPAQETPAAAPDNTSSQLLTAAAQPSTRAKAARKLRRKAKRVSKKKKPKTLLIPFVEDIVPVVDMAAGRIEITPPPGLIDL